jgi:hypothetical protein
MPLKPLLLFALLLAAWSCASADTKIVQLSGDTLTAWTDYPATGVDYVCIDEYPYSDADYVSTTGTANGLYQCGDSTLSAGATITSVTVYVRMKGTELDDAVRPILTVAANRYGDIKYTTTSYVDQSMVFSVSGWTADSLTRMKIGIDPYGTPVGTITVSQVYAVVTYTPAATGYPAGRRADNAGVYPMATNAAVQVRGKQ